MFTLHSNFGFVLPPLGFWEWHSLWSIQIWWPSNLICSPSFNYLIIYFFWGGGNTGGVWPPEKFSLSRETVLQPWIELPTTPFSLDTFPLSCSSLGSSPTQNWKIVESGFTMIEGLRKVSTLDTSMRLHSQMERFGGFLIAVVEWEAWAPCLSSKWALFLGWYFILGISYWPFVKELLTNNIAKKWVQKISTCHTRIRYVILRGNSF